MAFASQVCNETLLDTQRRGSQTVYVWSSKEPHDYLDTLAMAYAGASQLGLRYGNGSQKEQTVQRKRTRIRII